MAEATTSNFPYMFLCYSMRWKPECCKKRKRILVKSGNGGRVLEISPKEFNSKCSRGFLVLLSSLSHCPLIPLRRALCLHSLLAVWSVSCLHLWLNSQKIVSIFLSNCWWSSLFFWKITDLKMYVKLQHLIKSALILSHKQAQVKPGFRSNKGLTADYMPTDNTVAICSVHDYFMFHYLQVPEVEKSKDLLESCRQARKKYFDNQQSRATLSAEKTETMETRKKAKKKLRILK